MEKEARTRGAVASAGRYPLPLTPCPFSVLSYICKRRSSLFGVRENSPQSTKSKGERELTTLSPET